MPLTRDSALEALHDVVDPELGINIVDLGLVYDVLVDAAGVTVRMTLTSPACPLSGLLARQAEDALRRHAPDVGRVHVDVVWEPKWTPERMSPEAKRTLGWNP